MAQKSATTPHELWRKGAGEQTGARRNLLGELYQIQRALYITRAETSHESDPFPTS